MNDATATLLREYARTSPASLTVSRWDGLRRLLAPVCYVAGHRPAPALYSRFTPEGTTEPLAVGHVCWRCGHRFP